MKLVCYDLKQQISTEMFIGSSTFTIGPSVSSDLVLSDLPGEGLVFIKQEEGVFANPLDKQTKNFFKCDWDKKGPSPIVLESKQYFIVLFAEWEKESGNKAIDWDVNKFPNDPLDKKYPEKILQFVLDILGKKEGGLFVRRDQTLHELAKLGLEIRDNASLMLNRFISEAQDKKIFKVNFDTHSFLFRGGLLPSDFFILRNSLDEQSEVVLYLPFTEEEHLPKGILQVIFHLLSNSISLHLASRIHRKNLFKIDMNNLDYYWGETAVMKRNKDIVDKIAPSDLSMIIFGETGTGKEGIAQYVAKETGKHLVTINCAAIPENLAESVLFGHEKGAFTGALKSEQGKIKEAHGGILFLDEIGELSLEIQAKLLRFLQTGVISPVGGRDAKVNVRIVSATHRDLIKMVREGTFREDLFYRLNEATITLPPLRERAVDLEILSGHFFSETVKKNNLSEKFLLPEAQQLLVQYNWPGNIRELRSCMRRLAILSDGQVVTAADVQLVLPNHTSGGQEVKGAFDLNMAKNQFIQSHLEKVLAYCHGNKTEAAKLLGISQRSLFRYLADESNSGSEDDNIVSDVNVTH